MDFQQIGRFMKRMSGVMLDLDEQRLQRNYTKEVRFAYSEIADILREHGFITMGDGVYFGNPDTVDAVTTTLAIQDVARRCKWLRNAVKTIYFANIENVANLIPAVESGT